MAAGAVVAASGVTAGGFVVGGIAGGASNVAHGVKEVRAAHAMKKIASKEQHEQSSDLQND